MDQVLHDPLERLGKFERNALQEQVVQDGDARGFVLHQLFFGYSGIA